MGAADRRILPLELAFVDLETTGGNAAYHRITEIGIVRVVDDAIVEEWSTLVNPECRIPPQIQAFTGIDDAMVADAPRFREIAATVAAKLDGALFVAHNARFDYSFLRSEFRRAEREFAAKVLCTVKLSRRLYPDQSRHNLDAVMQRHGLVCSARHRALGDARVLADLWFKLRREPGEERLGAALDAVLAAHALPPALPGDLAEDLPEGPGVYRFFGEGGVLLYVGKSISLRSRVLAHFAAEHRDSKEHKLARQVRRVDWIETAGELGALLTEAALVKAQKPLHNRRLRATGGGYTWALAADGSGRIEIAAIEDLGAASLPRWFGLFHSRRDAAKAIAGIARAGQLCLKSLGLEEGEGSCFAYQIGRCRGACVGREPLPVHGARVQLALAPLKLQAWPFPGRIALRERGAAGAVELHVLDHWTHLGTARSDEELAEIAAAREPAQFDADVYRILARHFAGTARLDWIDLRPKTACA